MKRIGAILMMIVMVTMLIGCGGKTVENKTQETENKGTVLDQGYWVLDSMLMDGTELAKKDIEGLFGPCDGVGAYVFYPDGTMKAVLFGEFIQGTYTGNPEAFTVDIQSEKMKGSCTEDGKLELYSDEKNKFILIQQEEMPEALTQNPWVTYVVDFDDEETRLMSNFMSYGRYYIEDDVLYGLTHANKTDGQFAATPFYMKGDFPEFKETIILDPDGTALYINKHEDYLYYVRDWAQVCRVHMDGTGLEVLYDGTCDYLQVHDGKLYFTDADFHYVSMELDGSNVTTVIDKEIYYPYFICSDWMVFQDDADGESLHLYNTTFKEELKLTYMVSHNPIIYKNYLYFEAINEGGAYICKLDMSDPYETDIEVSDNYIAEYGFLIDESYIYTANNTKREIEQWKELSDTSGEFTEMEMHVSDKYTVYHYFDAEGYIESKYLMSKERNGGTSFK